MHMRSLVMSRRKALTTVLAAAGAVFGGTGFARVTRAADGPRAVRPPASVVDDGDARLRADLARLGERAYSDEGIPVFLACVNVAGAKAGEPGAEVTQLNAKVASDLHQCAGAWQRLFPEAPVTDVSRVIEVMAERDFGSLYVRGGA